jgi:hypothetical protein
MCCNVADFPLILGRTISRWRIIEKRSHSMSGLMRGEKSIACLLAALFLVLPGIVLSQNADHNRMLVINNQSTQVPVMQVNGGDYVDIEALASTINGLVSFAGTQIALSVPFSSATAVPTANAAKPASSSAPESHPVSSKGHPLLPATVPWIVSNPIFIGNGADFPLPSPPSSNSMKVPRARKDSSARVDAIAIR